MANIAEKYYVRRGEQQFATIASLFGGVRVLKVEGMTDVGSTKNVYTASWVGSQTEDYMVAGDSVVRENVDINITFIVSNKYGAVNVRQQHDAFIAYMTDGELYIKSDYVGRVMRCVCIKDYKPTSVHIERSGNTNDYMIGTLQLHTLDNRAGDDDGYIANPYPSSGGSTPTPTPTPQVNTTNVYDTALGATQASLNQHFEDSDNELADAIRLKQDIIQDLETIRIGANKGETAVQPNTLNGYVNGGRYNDTSKKIELLHNGNVLARIDASAFIIDGMVDDVRIENGYLIVDFNTDSGKQDISIPLTDIFNPNNYYNKSQINELLNAIDAVIARKVNISDLADVATSGSYNDLSNKPHIPNDQVQSDWNQRNTSSVDYIKNKPELSTVSRTGSYNDLLDKPTIPSAQIQSDWNQTVTSRPDYIKNKPTIPVVPTKVSAFTNDAHYLVPSDLSVYVNGGRYNNQNERIELLHDSTVVAYINASDFAFSGMIDDVEVIGGNLVITFTTTTGQKSVSIPITSIFDPNNYYTKSQVNDKIDTETLHPITQQEFNEIFN